MTPESPKTFVLYFLKAFTGSEWLMEMSWMIIQSIRCTGLCQMSPYIFMMREHGSIFESKRQKEKFTHLKNIPHMQ